ncbi:PREDICTED: ubiquitin-like protein 4A [Rhagoletis zephyria]|uniref:ubiquitin-like protein 4A n=1 Tax=Rhagoletis zephyria TaxID=28612 RepID=UPI00081141D7|nr:PREDICTED: ubiquitin-like protein 4A [Rhagoletis zephyria]XP_036322160.1 ubiquitin-like protein 4A [Rhagoletis pomonella]
MQITIKVLKGQDFTLEVESATTILEIKNEIENKLQIPLSEQKLLLFGRTLNDENTVSSYPNIRDGSKLNLVVMRQRIEGLREVIHRSFRKYYNEQQTDKLVSAFMSDFEANLKQMSLDDIDRLSENLIIA